MALRDSLFVIVGSALYFIDHKRQNGKQIVVQAHL